MWTRQEEDRLFEALDEFRIELPSWGFAQTGTRFGKFLQAAAATTTAEKLADAGQVHRVTGACPAVAVHVLWDLPHGIADAAELAIAAGAPRVQTRPITPHRISI